MEKVNQELDSLLAQGLLVAGNPMASVLLVKGTLTSHDLESGLLSGPDGDALKKALNQLGYAPEDWTAVASRLQDGSVLNSALMRQAVYTMTPNTVVILDDDAQSVFRNAFASELTAIPDLSAALLSPGEVVHLLGMRILNLGGFEASLGDSNGKRLMWSRLKQIPPIDTML